MHRLHHSLERMTWLSGFRTSLAHGLLLTFFPQFVLPFMLLGLSRAEAGIVFSLQILAQVWAHANIADERRETLGLLISPAYHRVHHSLDPAARNRNFASVFVFWDKLFGTYADPAKFQGHYRLGLDDWPDRGNLTQAARLLIGV